MSYISSLNLLNADSPAPINEEVFQEELALWANAQFSFDTTPGSALVSEDDKKDETLFQTFTKLTQLVQPNVMQQPSIGYYNHNHNISPAPTPNLPRIAPAPGPPSGIQLLESNNKKRPYEDESDLSVDDDKRRRNTAASARFRMKKKLREQALEKTTKEMAENVERLESKVKELEMEAKWLRALVIEKDPKLLSKQELAADDDDEEAKDTQEQDN
ncbi:unnamed protein product [Mucor circinelloides]|uniref:BZIP domain-containing protein n=1 Tax=Mucor circinelloides f. circinelloides (strain 1006PhL) TaxID=1220926 RepID=S2JDS8_MUCC1|nr:hypothetical protein HMPREF1544_05255 [Mucor circinelloides 1006PhL]